MATKTVLLKFPQDRNIKVKIIEDDLKSDLQLLGEAVRKLRNTNFSLKDVCRSGKELIFKKFDDVFRCQVEITDTDEISNGSVIEVRIINSPVQQVTLPNTSDFRIIEVVSNSQDSEEGLHVNEGTENGDIEFISSPSTPRNERIKCSSKQAFVTHPCPLPSFSPVIEAAIKNGTILNKYKRFVRECRSSLLSLVETPSRRDYENFSRTISENYPFVNDTCVTGVVPYFSFKKALTQSIRNARHYYGKKKSNENACKVTALNTADTVPKKPVSSQTAVCQMCGESGRLTDPSEHENSMLVKCIQCWEILHPKCLREKYPGLTVENFINGKVLKSFWLCPTCRRNEKSNQALSKLQTAEITFQSLEHVVKRLSGAENAFHMKKPNDCMLKLQKDFLQLKEYIEESIKELKEVIPMSIDIRHQEEVNCLKKELKELQKQINDYKSEINSKENELKSVCTNYEHEISMQEKEIKRLIKLDHTNKQKFQGFEEKLDLEKEIELRYEKKLNEIKKHIMDQHVCLLKTEVERVKEEWTKEKMFEIKAVINSTKQELKEEFVKCLDKLERNCASACLV